MFGVFGISYRDGSRKSDFLGYTETKAAADAYVQTMFDDQARRKADYDLCEQLIRDWYAVNPRPTVYGAIYLAPGIGPKPTPPVSLLVPSWESPEEQRRIREENKRLQAQYSLRLAEWKLEYESKTDIANRPHTEWAMNLSNLVAEILKANGWSERPQGVSSYEHEAFEVVPIKKLA